MEWRLRPATLADYPRIAEIASSQLAEPVTVEEMHRQDALLRPEDSVMRLVVETPDGLVAGSCHCLSNMHLKPGLFRMAVRVDEVYWNRGAGRLLYREVESWAREHGATRLQAAVREQYPQALAWAERRGSGSPPWPN